MPRHKTFIGSHQVMIETERPITHLLVGQLNEDAARPQALLEKEARAKQLGSRAKPEERLTVPEIAAVQKWVSMKSRGAFEPKPLDWCESAEEAEMARERWPAYVNFRTLPVEVHIP